MLQKHKTNSNLKPKPMTLFYQSESWSSHPQPGKSQVKLWKHIANKENWRIVQLINGFYQTEYQDIKDPETGMMLPGVKQWKQLKQLSTKQ